MNAFVEAFTAFMEASMEAMEAMEASMEAIEAVVASMKSSMKASIASMKGFMEASIALMKAFMEDIEDVKASTEVTSTEAFMGAFVSFRGSFHREY